MTIKGFLAVVTSWAGVSWPLSVPNVPNMVLKLASAVTMAEGEPRIQVVRVGGSGLHPPAPFTFTSPGEWPTWIATYKDVGSTFESAEEELDVRLGA